MTTSSKRSASTRKPAQWTQEGDRFIPKPAKWILERKWEDINPKPKGDYDDQRRRKCGKCIPTDSGTHLVAGAVGFHIRTTRLDSLLPQCWWKRIAKFKIQDVFRKIGTSYPKVPSKLRVVEVRDTRML